MAQGGKLGPVVAGGCLLVLLCLGCLGLGGWGYQQWTVNQTLEAEQQRAAAEAEVKAREEEKQAEEQAALHGNRPEHMPCRVEMVDREGRLDNYWSFRYDERGRPQQGRNENSVKRQALARELGSTEVEELMSQQPWTISYTYSEAGKLTRYREEISDATIEATEVGIDYDSMGRVRHWRVNGIEHRVTSWIGKNPGTVETTLASREAVLHYVYDLADNPLLATPFVFGRGAVVFGNTAVFVALGKRPERKLSTLQYGGPQGGLSLVRGDTSDYVFLFDCP